MRRVLVIALDLAGVGVESERRVRVEVVAGPVVGDPGARVPRTPVGRVRGRIIDPGNPGRSAASFVGLAFPAVATRLVGRRHGICFPDALSGERVKRAYGAPNAELVARVAGDDFAAHRKRRQGRVATCLVVIERDVPNLFARRGVKSYEGAIGCRHVDVVTVERDSAVGRMEL